MRPSPYTVVFNDRALRSAKTGVGHYLAELLTWLARIAPDNRYVPFYFTWIARRPPALGSARLQAGNERSAQVPEPPILAPRRHSWPVRRFLQEAYQCLFASVAKPAGYDLYHEPNHIPMPWQGPTVTTVHDLSVLRFPQWHPADRVAWYEQDFERGVRQTEHFIAVSEFTRQEMIDLAGVEPARITVIYEAPREVFQPAPPDRIQQTLHSLDLPESFFLFVGTIEPRKNLQTLLEAYSRLTPSVRRRHRLVIAGPQGWGAEPRGQEPNLFEALRDSICFTGYLSDEQLAALFSACAALVWPSLYEGFGLPPLECMACERPVIASDVASLPEVVGDAAILIDPNDPIELRDAMTQIVEDPSGADELARRGLERARRFSWCHSAEQHVVVYDRFVGF